MSDGATYAQELLRELGAIGKPDLDFICSRLRLRCIEKDFEGFEGVLLRCKAGSQWAAVVGVSRRVRDNSRKRFTIAHEIGHYLMCHCGGAKPVCQGQDLDRYDHGHCREEREANEFAAELLLPTACVREKLPLEDPCMEGVSTVAREFETSLTATTWRLLELTDQPCAMVWIQDGEAVWYRNSLALPFRLPVADLPAPGSVAFEMVQGNRSHGTRQVQADAWFERGDASKIRVLIEDSVPLPNYNAVLSLLWARRMEDLDGEEEAVLEELDPEEFTLGRKRWPR